MDTITFQCYSCNQVLKVGANNAGKKAKCVKCGTILTIPVASASETAPARAAPATPAAPAAPAAPKPAAPVRQGPPPAPAAPAAEAAPRRRPREDDDDRPRRRRDEESRDRESHDRESRRDREDFNFEEGPPRPRRREAADDDRPARRRDDDDRPRRREEEDDDYDRPRRASARDKWPKVRVGLLLNFIAAAVLIGHAGVSLGSSLFAYLGLLTMSLGMLQVSFHISAIGMFLYFVLQIPNVVGYVFNLFTPNKHGTLGLAIANLVLGGINLVLKVIFVLIPMFQLFRIGGRQGMGVMGGGLGMFGGFGMGGAMGGSIAAAIIIGILVILLLDSEWIVFPIFLRSVGLATKDRDAAGGAMPPMFMACGVIGMKLLMILLVLGLVGSAPRAAGGAAAWGHIMMILNIATYGLMLGFAIMFMRSIGTVRNSIDY